ncbi:MAG: aminoglycoside phosphotransferase family protein [Bacteroidota bacterium]
MSSDPSDQNRLLPVEVHQQFFGDRPIVKQQVIGSGHIHQTYRVSVGKAASIQHYIVQRLNTQVFSKPQAILQNIQTLNQYLKNSTYPLALLEPWPALSGDYLIVDDQQKYWRAFPYLENTLALDQAEHPEQVYEAAWAFGTFSAHTRAIDTQQFNTILPNFHDVQIRYRQWEKALLEASPRRLKEAAPALQKIRQYAFLLKQSQPSNLPLRLCHYDTKINNVLLDAVQQKAICIIDLDTLMPGYLMYDFGDMVRTMAVQAGEEERDLTKVALWPEAFEALCQGFLSAMQGAFLPGEFQSLLSGAYLIVYEQALRFMTDFLQGNSYYTVYHPQQNLWRAENQLQLLQSLLDHRAFMEAHLHEENN